MVHPWLALLRLTSQSTDPPQQQVSLSASFLGPAGPKRGKIRRNVPPRGASRKRRQRFFQLCLAISPASVVSTYSGLLSSNSPVFIPSYSLRRELHHYQSIQVSVSSAGTYGFTSSSDFDTVGIFYVGPFDSSNPAENRIQIDDDGGGGSQFLITTSLQPSQTYVLVVTTLREGETGRFSIRAYGPSSVNLREITPSSNRPISNVGQ